MFQLVKSIFMVGPLLFGLGFLAPLMAQILRAVDVTLPWGLTPLAVGLFLGCAYGLVAQFRGRWI
ncbi:MAG: hypothetical protein AAF216_10910 [Pseudomonadota bacterium]